jgi:RimJ/RimL family protein N-acetyltransferase
VSEPHPATGQPVGLRIDATPAPWPEAEAFEGRYCSLLKLTEGHTDELWAAFEGHDEIWTYLSTYGPFADKREFADWVASRVPLEDPRSYTVFAEEGRAVGIVTLVAIEPEHRRIEVGHIVYSPSLMRTRAATEAQYLLAKYVFEELGYRRYEWKCNALNEGSRNAALRLGFTYEGLFRQHVIAKGRNRDNAWFSMLDTEWPARKAAFERWLDPSNFDDDGQQREPLSGRVPLS